MNADLQAPAADGAVRCHPPQEQWPALARSNRLAANAGQVGGLPRQEWQALARAEFAVAAGQSLDPAAPWIATGHQPELFHPGVWLKSFAVARTAAAAGGVGLHVRTDNDLAAALRLNVAGPAGIPASVPLDLGSQECPWEERRADDLVFFLDFPARAAEFAGDLSATPTPALSQGFRARLLADPEVPLGELFADGRQSVERAWGVANAEAPLSRLCGGEAFNRFTADVLRAPVDFAVLFNRLLADHQRVHRVRSKNHPASFLGLNTDFDRCETPFWGWTAKEPRRRPVEASIDQGRIRLHCGDLEAPLGSDPHEDLAALPFKLRPRALLTTAFLRLGLADLFVHGLGGARYDTLTDELLRHWWKLEPPAYAVATGTLRLPHAPALEPLAAELRAARQRARSLRWNPDFHLPEHLAEAEALAPALERKAELLEAEPPDRAARRARWREFRAVGDQLRPYVTGELAAAERAAAAAADRHATARLLASREFAWCLHPETRLRAFLQPH